MENQSPEVIPVEQNPPVQVTPSQPGAKQKKILIFGILGLFICGVIILVLFLLLSAQKKPDQPTGSQPQLPSQPAPKLTVEKFEDRSSLGNTKNSPLTGQSFKVYPLTNSLPQDEVNRLKEKLALSNAKFEKSTDSTDLYSKYEGEKSEYLLLNHISGTFDYYSYKGIKPSQSGSPQQIAIDTLTFLNIYDPTIACPITYQRSNIQDIMYVECHRSWNELGAPLLNPVGLANISEGKLMASLAPGYVDANGPKDSTVINVNTKQNGLARPTDFNAVVVGIEKDGRVVSVRSAMRPFASKPVGTQQVISPQEALTKVKNNTADMTFTVPTGNGNVDLDKLYKDGKADASDGIITDVILGYIEKPFETQQELYEPYYIVRGVATLKSGYTVRFVQAVKARKDTAFIPVDTSALSQFLSIPKAQAQTTRRTTNLGVPTPTTNPACVEEGGPDCTSKEQFSTIKVFDIPGYGVITVGQVHGKNNTYYLITTTGSTDKNAMIEAIAKGICPSMAIWECRVKYPKVFMDSGGSQTNIDPKCYITGMSPALFVYPTIPTDIYINVGRRVTYSDPGAVNNSFKFHAMPDGQIISEGVERPVLYYEYDPQGVVFSNGLKGFVGDTGTIDKTVEKIAGLLDLTPKETERLIIEVQNALPKNSPLVKLSIANPNEIHKNIPLTFSIRPDTLQRIHILVSPVVSSSEIEQPELQPIKRHGFTIIELGAYTQL